LVFGFMVLYGCFRRFFARNEWNAVRKSASRFASTVRKIVRSRAAAAAQQGEEAETAKQGRGGLGDGQDINRVQEYLITLSRKAGTFTVVAGHSSDVILRGTSDTECAWRGVGDTYDAVIAGERSHRSDARKEGRSIEVEESSIRRRQDIDCRWRAGRERHSIPNGIRRGENIQWSKKLCKNYAIQFFAKTMPSNF